MSSFQLFQQEHSQPTPECDLTTLVPWSGSTATVSFGPRNGKSAAAPTATRAMRRHVERAFLTKIAHDAGQELAQKTKRTMTST
jgi:hypothetical protein